ncbi:MAG: ABC transporter ATP-binding protein [Phycisphaerales bacterium]|nr:ABC transporter ATP-binding protein [Phycisphaerales bacterium]
MRVVGVRKSYRIGARVVEALRGAELTIEQPGFYAIMGPSGSGKSTLLHLLAGLDRPDAGTVEVSGQRVDRMSERELTLFRRRTVGVVFQQHNLIPTLSALDNVMLPGLLDRRDRRELERRASGLLADLGLHDRGHHRPDALSGGEQQRVGIARALLFSPGVLLADEPTGNLDSANSDHMWRLLHELAERQRMTVVMVTHEPAAATHCRRVFVIRDGVVAGSFESEGIDAVELAHRTHECCGTAR